GYGEVVLGALVVPNDVEYDPAEGLFVSETGAGRVSRVAILPDGSLGEAEVLATGIDDAEGLELGADGALYVAGGGTVYRITDGVTTAFADDFEDPEGLAIDANGDLFVSDDSGGVRITRVEVHPGGTAGRRTEIATVPGNSAKDIEFGPDGRLYVANNQNTVYVIDFATDGSGTAVEFARLTEAPSALAFDDEGVLFVGTANGRSVWSVDPSGEPEVRLTGFDQVEGLTFDRSGSLYVVDVANDQILRFQKGSTGGVSIPQPITESDTTWRRTELTESWADSIVDVASLPDGGFVVATVEGGSILWSRDGIDWTEADPTGHVSESLDSAWLDRELDLVVALPGDLIAVLGSAETQAQVWIGNLATREWESIRLDGSTSWIESMAIAANDREVLVVAPTVAENTDSVIWKIDAATGAVERLTAAAESLVLPDDAERGGFEDVWPDGRAAQWFEGRWVIATGNTTATSPDGVEWTFGLDDRTASYPEAVILNGWVTSLSAGPSGILATTCGGWGPHDAWFSEDGLEWIKTPQPVPGPHSGSAYSDALGFVLTDSEAGRLWQSADGRTWSYTPRVISGAHDIAVSDDVVFVARHGRSTQLLTPSD
nr:hypothetical protein [Acidimicrobiia bacterium]